jgi:predicted ATP-binding protein involved in virulence/transcriptional regulator with XRE-family HTH domain
MDNSNSSQSFHSGKRLQKLRELQGLSISELASELRIEAAMLEEWESSGIPSESIEKCSFYFEVSTSLFEVIVTNQFELERLVREQLFPQNDNSLNARLNSNKASQSARLDLSSLGLSEIPTEVFGFSWLTALNISDNQFKQLPSAIVLLQQLETLDISRNLLAQIPGIICALSQLKILNYQGNPLSLQLALLDATMSLEAYQAYLIKTELTVGVLDQITTETLLCLDDARNTIEQTHSLIISHKKSSSDIELNYKHISSIVYISENNDPDNLVTNIKILQPKQTLPLLILFSKSLTTSQNKIVKDKLRLVFPTHFLLLTIIKNKNEFNNIFDDMQRRISYQNQLPCLKLEKLTLINIGVYEQLDIAFNQDLTVLIGLNGAGKTTILKALALAILGPEQAEIDDNTAANLLRITGKQRNQTLWQPKGSIQLHASINGKAYENIINLNYNTNSEKVDIKGSRFDKLFDDNGHLINLMLGIGEQRNTSPKKPHSLGLEVLQPKARDLLPIISNEEQTCIAHFTSWLGNLALSVSQGDANQQQAINISFAIFSALMQESIQFAGLTRVNPLELWVEHQTPKQIIPLRLVSQGYQAVMGWVGYIIQRMFEAYAGTLQPLQQPAIIIIDEIDQLLHVKWQQKILQVLAKEFFPNTQWIITTHSPMVVTGLDQGQVIQLHQRDGKLIAEANTVDLWLWQYGDVVRYLFEVSPERPQVQEQQLIQEIDAIKALPITGQAAQQQALTKLEMHLEKVQKSRAFIDELYAEQQKLRAKEQELAALIKHLSQKQITN